MKKVFISVILVMTALSAEAQELSVMTCSVYRGREISDMTGYMVTQNGNVTKLYSIEDGQIQKEYSNVAVQTFKIDQVSSHIARNLKSKLRKSVLRKATYVNVVEMSMIHQGKKLVNVYDKDNNNLGGVIINQNWFERKCHPLGKENIFGFMSDHDDTKYLFGN